MISFRPLGSLTLSLALHSIVFGLLMALSESQTYYDSKQKQMMSGVTVHLSTPLHRPNEQSSSALIQTKSALGRRAVDVKKLIQGVSLNNSDDELDSLTSADAAPALETQDAAIGHDDEHFSSDNSFESVFDVISPCRSVVLPERLLNLDGLFPRKYSLTFSLKRDSKTVFFRILELHPEGEQLPYADRLISNAFETCVNQLGTKLLLVFQEKVQALNPVAIDAYSVSVEFESRRTAGELNKGI